MPWSVPAIRPRPAAPSQDEPRWVATGSSSSASAPVEGKGLRAPLRLRPFQLQEASQRQELQQPRQPWAPKQLQQPVAQEASPAPKAQSSADLFQSIENDLASRRIRMSNFPASWVSWDETQFLTKIRNLLSKFGTLEQSPTVSRSSGQVVATATFMEAKTALMAAQTLHNVDNRTEAEKKKVNHTPPKDFERFCVQVVGGGPLSPLDGDRPPGPSADANPGSKPHDRHTDANSANGEAPTRQPGSPAAPSQASRWVQISELPSEWTPQDIKELCGQYGTVEDVRADGPGRFAVAFSGEGTADAAVESLNGLQIQNEVGYITLACKLIMEPKSATADLGAVNGALASKDDQAKGRCEADQEVYDPEMAVEPEEGPPFLLYIDELQLASGDPVPDNREIYLRDLPLEDYSEQQLHEWLDSFGNPERVVFLRDLVTKQLTGRGYVQFNTHEEATGLLAAFPVDDEEDNVRGSWSLSERFVQAAASTARANVFEQLMLRLKGIGAETGCSSLYLAGAGQEADVPALARYGLQAGPLHFAAWPQARSEENAKKLQDHLKRLLAEVAGGLVDGTELPKLVEKVHPEEFQPTAPCIIVRGFPAGWKEQQVRLVFALFGGVASVHFVHGPAGSRSAHVCLKNSENMTKAVEQLHGTQVGDGDLIEECTLQCELFNAEDSADSRPKGPTQRALFVDDLPMRRRPEVPAGEKDREVFLSALPVKDCSEDQIKGWLEGFGVVEDMHLVRDSLSGEFNGKGYVRFHSHAEANACVESQASAADAEEGDVVASWSESERAGQRSSSIYGMDVHTAFAGPSGRVLASILVSSKMKELWMFSELHQPKDKGAPKPEGNQLHFITTCDDEQFEELRTVLGDALAAFHEKVARRLKEAKSLKDREKESVKDKEAGSKSGGGQQNSGPGGSPPPWHSPPANDSWQGYPPGGWYDWRARPPQDQLFARPPPPPPGWFPRGYPPGPPGGCPGGEPPPCGPPPGPGPAPGQGPSPEQSRAVDSCEPHGQARHGKRKGENGEREHDEEVTSDPALQGHITKGEQLIRDGKSARRRGHSDKAYEKYCRGLQYLLDVMPKLGADKPKAQAFRLRINGYLDEAEKLKQQLDALEAETTKEMPEMQDHGPSPHLAQDDGAGMPAADDGGCGRSRHRHRKHHASRGSRGTHGSRGAHGSHGHRQSGDGEPPARHKERDRTRSRRRPKECKHWDTLHLQAAPATRAKAAPSSARPRSMASSLRLTSGAAWSKRPPPARR